MARRHPELNATPANPKITEMDKELAVIKERLRTTENELLTERNARLGSAHSATTQPTSVELTLLLQKQIEEKSNEVKKIKEEMKRSKMTLNNEIHELSEKNNKLEKSLKELQERLGKESHVGWIKDDIDLEKDTVIKLKNENDILNQTVSFTTHLIIIIDIQWLSVLFCDFLDRKQ
jgi:gas vesicle protein